jgi:hypothetical protein
MSNKSFKRGKALTSLLAATDELMDAVQQLSDRFTNKGNMFSVQDTLGKDGEVSVSIPAGGTGEVLIAIGNALHNYPARGVSDKLEFKRGQRVRVIELANQTLLVDEAKSSRNK